MAAAGRWDVWGPGCWYEFDFAYGGAVAVCMGQRLDRRGLAQWTRSHPQSRVRLRIGNTSEVIDAVAGFVVDVGFIEGPQTHPDLVVRRWRRDELVVFAAPYHPLAGRTATARQLANAVWVLREPGSGTRQSTDRWLLAHLERLDVGYELGSTEAIKRLVAASAGLGCLSRHAVAQALENGWLVELKTRLPACTRQLALVMHRDKLLGRATADFVAHCAA